MIIIKNSIFFKKFLLFFLLFFISFSFVSASPFDLPLINIEDFDYQGGFRIKSGNYNGFRTGFTPGLIAYNPDSDALFYTSHIYHNAIGETPIPDLVKSNNYKDMLISPLPIQNFTQILQKSDTGNTQGIDRLGALYYLNNELLVHSFKYYDAAAGNSHTSLLFRNANNLKDSEVDGFFSFQGAAKLVSYIGEVPEEFRPYFNADFFSGSASNFPINGRSSIGPSFYLFNSSSIFQTNLTNGTIKTQNIMSFGLKNVFANTPQGWSSSWDGVNTNGNNDLWTQSSSAKFGIILPNSRTFAVFGQSGMHFSGGGYKIRQTNGRLCGGYCPRDNTDSYSYYWFFDLKDLYDMKLGLKKPYEIKPYDYGVLPFIYPRNELGSGTFDTSRNLIYISKNSVDSIQSRYEPTPIILAYNYSKKTDYSHLNLDNFYDIEFYFVPEELSLGDNFTIRWKTIGFSSCSLNGPISRDINKIGFLNLNLNETSQGNYLINCINNRTGFSHQQEIFIGNTSNSNNSFFGSPLKPYNLSTVEIKNTSIYLTWKDLNLDVLEYQIFRDNQKIANTTGKFYIDRNLTLNTTYNYFIKVINIYNLSNQSENFSFTTLYNMNNSSEQKNESEPQKKQTNQENPSSQSSQEQKNIQQITSAIPKTITCVSSFTYTDWEPCTNGVQSRIRIDLNNCVSNKIVSRSCSELGEEELQKFEKISLNYLEDRVYYSSFSTQNEIFQINNTNNSAILIFNLEDNLYYLGVLINESSNLTLYSIEVIDENLISSGILEEKNLLNITQTKIQRENIIIEDVYTSSLLEHLIFIFFGIFVILLFFIFHYYLSKKRAELQIKKAQQRKKIHSTSHIREVRLLREYLEKRPDLNEKEAREVLSKMGWKKEILDKVFHK